MRRITSVSTDDESEVNITPLIDIVFIMLIFFIVTATFVKEAGIDVNKPDAPTAEVKKKANILIAIDANNNIWLDRRKIDIRSVIPNIKRLRAENPQGSVVIQADEESKNKMLVEVMDAARQAGVVNIALAAER
ncbi:MAG: biopolymer transporter ExbD [Gammaproteobacteria bacterium]|nr:biopolymer transporter ExbD [Gammaproteobacteria bacterium]MDE0156192.1 biopolymer transporter ExbD [Gammaproteobacteria bacterium]MDE0286083.1 biopolymer transporter ExbD [Gammaproteobacteria bacterium]MDE0511277.1 biopolymer transporter ExbD [Gammaproteobacteria bacterium]